MNTSCAPLSICAVAELFANNFEMLNEDLQKMLLTSKIEKKFKSATLWAIYTNKNTVTIFLAHKAFHQTLFLLELSDDSPAISLQ